jgi:chitodextrinase
MKQLTKISLLIIAFAISYSLFSQARVNWPGGMYAMSCDGNQHDKDDYGATPMAIALMYYAGLSDKIVHINHSDHMGNNSATMENNMIISTEGAADRFGPVSQAKVFNCQDGVTPIVNHFLAQAQNASATNPLWYICGGPMEVPWQCLNAVKNNIPNKLQYIHCISHSTWNENHNDADNNHTWSNMKNDFSQVTFHDIIDQNSSDGDNDWNTPRSKWSWLQNSSNPDWVWLYNRSTIKENFDDSDAGMTYWLISGGPNGGDQRGGWPEAKDLFENGGPTGEPTANAGPNQTVADANANGNETISLNGSLSSDSDGTILSYIWTEGGLQIATGVTPSVTLSVGIHNITLTVTDNDGKTNSDQVIITVTGLTAIPGRIQAEDYSAQSGVLTAITSDVDGNLHIRKLDDGDWTSYEVGVASAGDYLFDVRYTNGISEIGSMRILVDGSQIGALDLPSTGAWGVWDNASTTLSLAAGAHTLRLEFVNNSNYDYSYDVNWFEFTAAGDPCENNVGPTVSFSSPTSPVEDNAPVTICADASDSDGSISQVEFLIDGSSVGIDNSAPYCIDVNLTEGSYDVVAIATDNCDASASSATSLITVYHVDPCDGNVAPTISIASPNDGDEFYIGATLTVSANAVDDNLSSVTYAVDGQAISGNSFVMSAASHSITATATDECGESTTSATITVTEKAAPEGIPVPGIVEAEDFDMGAYSDTDAANKGDAGIRTEEGVDIDNKNGVICIGWCVAGEWTEYTIDAAQTGDYLVKYSFSTNANTLAKSFSFDIDGSSIGTVNILGNDPINSVGNLVFDTRELGEIRLSAGVHTLRWTARSNAICYDKVEFEFLGEPDTDAPSVPEGLTASNISSSSVVLSWDASSDNVGVTGYKVFQNGAEVADVTGTSATISGLSCEGDYSFTVSAYDAVPNNSAASIAADITTDECGAEPVSVELSPIHDAYIQGNTGNNNNLIRVESGNREGYLMFDLSSVNGQISAVDLVLTCTSDAGSGNINISKGSHNNWTETNISGTNKPAADGLLASKNVTYSVGNSYTWSLNASLITIGDKLSLIATHTSGNDVAFSSKENTNGPKLVVTYLGTKRATEEIAFSADFELYPNPVNGEFTIELSNVNEINTINIYNAQGEIVYNTITDNSVLHINSENWSSGMYFISVVSNNNSTVKQFVVK